MEKSHLDAQLAIIAALDTKYEPPEVRAKRIYTIILPLLEQMTDWDILCFCIQYIGWISQRFPFIEDSARELNRLLYTAHYYDRESDDDKGSDAPLIRKPSDSDKIRVSTEDGINRENSKP